MLGDTDWQGLAPLLSLLGGSAVESGGRHSFEIWILDLG
jgi:hypothetical protein